jgi:hypothetical protein
MNNLTTLANELSKRYKHIDLVYVESAADPSIANMINKGYVVYVCHSNDTSPLLVRQTSNAKKEIYLQQGLVAALVIVCI